MSLRKNKRDHHHRHHCREELHVFLLGAYVVLAYEGFIFHFLGAQLMHRIINPWNDSEKRSRARSGGQWGHGLVLFFLWSFSLFPSRFMQ